MKRIIVFLLAVVMAFSVFACAKNEGNKPATTSPNATTPDETTPGTTTPGATTEITTEMQVTVKNPDKPDLEVMTFGGTKYRVSTMEAYTNMEVFADEASANICDQSIWERNAYVEETYDVKIVPVTTAYDGDVLSHVNSVLDYIYIPVTTFMILSWQLLIPPVSLSFRAQFKTGTNLSTMTSQNTIG